MVERFEWVLGLFGLFLLYTGGKMFTHDDNELSDPSQNIIVRWFRKLYPVTDRMHGDRFFIVDINIDLMDALGQHVRAVAAVQHPHFPVKLIYQSLDDRRAYDAGAAYE